MAGLSIQLYPAPLPFYLLLLNKFPLALFLPTCPGDQEASPHHQANPYPVKQGYAFF